MAAALQSILGDGVNLPHDLLPDDAVLYNASGKAVLQIDYDDPDDELAYNSRQRKRYIGLALAHFNAKNHTDYKYDAIAEDKWCLHGQSGKTMLIHCGFTAVSSAAADCEPSAKHFVAELRAERDGEDGEEVVSSCRIVDGIKTVGCESCDISMCKPRNPSTMDMEADDTDSLYVTFSCQILLMAVTLILAICLASSRVEDDPHPSEYSHCLADGVTLSEKAKFRLPFPVLALAFYNKKHKKDYKLVDALPNCFSLEESFVVHCNFIARQNAPSDDVSNKLFFAELMKPEDDWVVTACRILHGCKTTAGCYYCTSRLGKRVVHPTRGFRFGLHRPVYRQLRRRS